MHPGMLMAAHDVLQRFDHPTRENVEDALGGVLCRCTGYQKIVEAVMDVSSNAPDGESPLPGEAVGSRVARLDGIGKLDGAERYGDDERPDTALWLRIVRSPHASATFTLGAKPDWDQAFPDAVAVLTAKDVPGNNNFGIYPTLKDQPVLADGFVRYRGEAIAILAFPDRATGEAADLSRAYHLVAERGRHRHRGAPREVGKAASQRVAGQCPHRRARESGDLKTARLNAARTVHGTFETSFVEHAYIEPDPVGRNGQRDQPANQTEFGCVSTQTPYMDRDEVAHVLGIAPERVQIIPSAVGGGFGGKLDQSVQLPLAVAAWVLERPVAMLYTARPDSMAATTKRHPARMTAALSVMDDGALAALSFHGDFDTGAYALGADGRRTRPGACTGPVSC